MWATESCKTSTMLQKYVWYVLGWILFGRIVIFWNILDMDLLSSTNTLEALEKLHYGCNLFSNKQRTISPGKCWRLWKQIQSLLSVAGPSESPWTDASCRAWLPCLLHQQSLEPQEEWKLTPSSLTFMTQLEKVIIFRYTFLSLTGVPTDLQDTAWESDHFLLHFFVSQGGSQLTF